jgi:hypothetical protein
MHARCGRDYDSLLYDRKKPGRAGLDDAGAFAAPFVSSAHVSITLADHLPSLAIWWVRRETLRLAWFL